MKLALQEDPLEIGGAEAQGTFKIKAAGKAFRVLIDGLYSNKIQSIVRETTANAFDSHIAAKQDKPFFVHMPTLMNPEFFVRDYGVGMDHEKVMGLYSTLFESDKDGTNDLVGAFGLGSKSPFAYTDMFCVSCYDGQEVRHYTAAIGQGGVPQIILNQREACDEPLGVRVSFGVAEKDFLEFKTAIQAVAMGFGEGFKSNASDLKSIGDIALEGKGWKSYTRSSLPSTWNVRQGCVIYPISSVGGLSLPHDYTSRRYLIDVPIGTVEVTSSRESIAYSDSVVNYLQSRLDAVVSEVPDLVKEKVKDIFNAAEFFQAVNSIKPSFVNLEYTHEPTGLKNTYLTLPGPECFMNVAYDDTLYRWSYTPKRRAECKVTGWSAEEVYLVEDISMMLDHARDEKEKGFNAREHRRIARLLRNWMTVNDMLDATFWLGVPWTEDFIARTRPHTKITKLTAEELYAAIPKGRKLAKPTETAIRGVGLLEGKSKDQKAVTKLEGTKDKCAWITAEAHRRDATEIRKVAALYEIDELYVASAMAYERLEASPIPSLWDAIDAKMKDKYGVGAMTYYYIVEKFRPQYGESTIERMATFVDKLKNADPQACASFLRKKNVAPIKLYNIVKPYLEAKLLPRQWDDPHSRVFPIIKGKLELTPPDDLLEALAIEQELRNHSLSPAVNMLSSINNAGKKSQLVATAEALVAVFKLLPTTKDKNWTYHTNDYD